MIKSIFIIGLISLIIGIITTLYINAYYSILAIIGFPLFVIGLVVSSNKKKKSISGPETIYCSNCGSVITKGPNYCPYCGEKL